MASSKRNLVLSCARELFMREGFHATGVDRILECAGVAKMTLYNNFGSKDQLIVEVLDESSLAMLARLKQAAVAAGAGGREQVLGIFSAFAEWYEDPEFCGCMFQAAVAEFPDHDSGPAQAAKKHLSRMTEFFTELCVHGGFSDAEVLGRKLAMLASGATCVARQARNRGAADDARAIAEVLLEQAGLKK